jgi:hypothetical protein
MAEPKQPTDHLPKKTAAPPPEDDGLFTFTFKGEDFTMPLAAADHLTPGFYRRNRFRDDADFGMTVWELLADGDEKILAVLDATGRANIEEANRVLKEFNTYIGTAPGES